MTVLRDASRISGTYTKPEKCKILDDHVTCLDFIFKILSVTIVVLCILVKRNLVVQHPKTFMSTSTYLPPTYALSGVAKFLRPPSPSVSILRLPLWYVLYYVKVRTYAEYRRQMNEPSTVNGRRK